MMDVQRLVHVYGYRNAIEPDTTITLTINRIGNSFTDTIAISQMKRGLEELASFVYRECSFPYGCMIMTGTGIVPGNDFTLRSGDEIIIAIDHIGKLVNIVA